MGINLSALRGYVDGTLDESAIAELNSAAQGYDLDGEELTDVEMQEAAALGMPIILQGEIMGDQCEALEEATIEAYQKLESYLVGQGYLSEAAAVPSNPKITVVRMSKDATMRRLKTMYTLLLARRNDDKAFKKYKLACGLKKANREIMDKKYGAKAERMAKKHWQATKGGKVKATVADAKDKASKAKAKD